MKSYTKRSLAAVVFLAGTAAFATPADDFIKENRTFEIRNGVPQALAAVEKQIAAGGIQGADLAKYKHRLAELQLSGDATKSKGLSLIMDDILKDKAALPETKLAAARTVMRFCSPRGGNIAILRDMSDSIRDLPDFAAKGDHRAEMLQIRAEFYNSRMFYDVACGLFLEAADNYSDQEKKIVCLFTASGAALKYRDMVTAEKCITKILELPGISPETERKALLTQALCLITSDEYDWKPAKERVAKAETLLEQAQKPLGRQVLLTAEQIFNAKAKLVNAYYRSGDIEKAAKLGEETVASPEANKVHIVTRGNLALETADILAQIGDWKNAIRHYEIAEKTCRLGAKNVNIKIAGVARAHKDYKRAMDAYAEAAKLCDHEEGKDEMNMLRRLAGVMSNAIRNKTSFATGDEVFGNTNDDLAGLDLDE